MASAHPAPLLTRKQSEYFPDPSWHIFILHVQQNLKLADVALTWRKTNNKIQIHIGFLPFPHFSMVSRSKDGCNHCLTCQHPRYPKYRTRQPDIEIQQSARIYVKRCATQLTSPQPSKPSLNALWTARRAEELPSLNHALLPRLKDIHYPQFRDVVPVLEAVVDARGRHLVDVCALRRMARLVDPIGVPQRVTEYAAAPERWTELLLTVELIDGCAVRRDRKRRRDVFPNVAREAAAKRHRASLSYDWL